MASDNCLHLDTHTMHCWSEGDMHVGACVFNIPMKVKIRTVLVETIWSEIWDTDRQKERKQQ